MTGLTISGHTRTGWTPEMDAALIACVKNDRMSFSQAASALSHEFNAKLTRNAAIGRAHRLGLSGNLPVRKPPEHYRAMKAQRERKRRLRIGIQPRAKREAVAKPKSRTKTLYEMFVPRPANDLSEIALHIPFIDLQPGHCKFPFGDGPFTFCGHARFDSGPYCGPHTLLCTGPGTSWERAADVKVAA